MLSNQRLRWFIRPAKSPITRQKVPLTASQEVFSYWWRFHHAMSSSSSPSSSPPPQANSKSSSNQIDSKKLIGNFATVARIMKTALPDNAKIAKEAKECMQECVSEFISFITSEGTFPSWSTFWPDRSAPGIHAQQLTKRRMLASEKCQHEKRKTVNGEDIIFAMTSLGFENYSEALRIYLVRYREVCGTSRGHALRALSTCSN